jgi:hypothetical protein
MKMKPLTSHCVICNQHFAFSISEYKNVNQDKIQLIFRQILSIFCKYLCPATKSSQNRKWNDVKYSDSSSLEDLWEFESFPFCVECRECVVELCNLHLKLESIHTQIHKIVARISSTIIHTEKEGNSHHHGVTPTHVNPDQPENTGKTEKIWKFRKKLVRR